MMMRHGKSNWDGSWTSDHERPLAPRGIKAAAQIGRFLSDSGHQPAVVISSSAERAEATARLAATAGRWTSEIIIEPRLYGAGPDVVIEIIQDIDPSIERALIVGHNPTWADCASLFSGGSCFRFPTAAVASLDLQDPWPSFRPGKAELMWFVTPRLLKDIP